MVDNRMHLPHQIIPFKIALDGILLGVNRDLGQAGRTHRSPLRSVAEEGGDCVRNSRAVIRFEQIAVYVRCDQFRQSAGIGSKDR